MGQVHKLVVQLNNQLEQLNEVLGLLSTGRTLAGEEVIEKIIRETKEAIKETESTLGRLGLAVSAAASVVTSAPRSWCRAPGEVGEAWDVLVSALGHVDMMDVGAVVSMDEDHDADAANDPPSQVVSHPVGPGDPQSSAGVRFPASALAQVVFIERELAKVNHPELVQVWSEFVTGLIDP